MKRLCPMGISASVIIAVALSSATTTACFFKTSLESKNSSSIEISRSQVVDPDTGSIIFVSYLKRN